MRIYSHFTLRTNPEVGRSGIITSILQMRNSDLISIISCQSVKKNEKLKIEKSLSLLLINCLRRNNFKVSFLKYTCQ